MKRANNIPRGVARCLWSYEPTSIDLRRDRELIVTQVLNHGDWREVRWLFKTYPEEEIRTVVAHPRRGLWFKRVLNFWCLILKVKLPPRVLERAFFRLGPETGPAK